MSVELRFCQIPCRWNLHSIPDSNRQRDQSKAQDFGFLKQTYFLRFRNPDYLSWSEVFFTNAIISIFFKFYTDCVYGWAKLIESANLMLNWFLLFSVSRWWHLVYMKSMLHQFFFPGIIFLWIFIEAATSSVPDFEHLNNIRNLFLAQPSEFEVLCIYFWKTNTWT